MAAITAALIKQVPFNFYFLFYFFHYILNINLIIVVHENPPF